MNLDKVMEDPWPALIDKLVSYLTREELDSIVDCLSDDILDRTRKKELRDIDIPKTVAIRKFIDTLSEDHGESGFMKLMLKVTETKQLTIRTADGKSPPLHEYLGKCEKERKRYKEYCREKRILKSCDFVGRKKEMVEVTKLLFRENDKIAGTWISGMGGAGKTTLANQVCGMQGKYRMLYIDLNMLKGDSRTKYTIDDFYKRLTGPLDIPPLQQDQKICWETIYEELRKKRPAVVLYLDSLETLLSPNNTDKKVWEILREILSIQNSKVKLLITSVHSPEDCMPGQDSLKNMEHYPLKLFTLEDCHKLIRRVAPKIIRDPKQKSNIETVVSKLCGFNTLAVQTVFSFLKNYSDCITLDKFVASPKQQLKLAENNDRKTSQVITTLGRVFEGLNRATQEGLIKLSLSNGVQFDFTLAQSLLGEGDTTTLYSLVKAHLLQMEVKDKASTAEQKIDDENTRFFLHSLLQNLLESKCDTGNFQEVVENAESNIRAYIKNRLLELEEMESHDPKGKAGVIGSELQPLVLKYSSMPSIDNEHAQSYIKAARFQASLQHFLDRKNLKQFYADQLEFADGPRQTLKWVFLKLSQIEVMLKTGSSIERAGVDLAEVEKKLNEFGNNRQTTALKLSWAHFDLVNGQYLGLCRDHDSNAIKSIQRALDVYEKEDGCSRQAARALHAIAIIHGNKPVDSYSTSECMKYEQRAFDRLGRSTIHFDQIVYSMSIGIKAHVLGGLKQSVIENAKEGKKELSHKEVDEYKKDIKEYYEKASTFYKMSIDLCEKLKMKRSLEYIQLLRQKALLLAESEDIKKIEKAVRLAEESYQLIQEYDKTDMAHLAKCCIAIAHVHKRLGVKMYDSIKAKEGLYTDEQRYAPLWEAYYKFKRGFKFIKDGKLSADMHDYYGWQGSLRETMRWLNLDENERKKVLLEIERYIKNNMHELKLYTRKTSVEERRSKDDRRRNISGAGKRHSIDTSQEDMVPPKRRNSSTDDTETMDLSSPVAGPSQSYYTHKRHSVSDDIPIMGLTLHTESMETCPEEKPTVFTKLKSSMRSTMGKLLPVLLIREPKKPDIRQDEKDPEDLSDSNSSVSDKDSALTGYSNSPSVISKSGSSDMELDTWVRQSPSRTSPRNYTYPHASISHDVRPAFGVPEIKVQDEGEQEGDSPDLSGKLPFDHYGITDSPCSNYKRYIKNNMHERKLYTRKTSVEERRNEDVRKRKIIGMERSDAIDEPQESLKTRKTSVEERRSKDDRRRNISGAGKRHSIDQSQEDMVPPKRRNSSTDDTETMDLSSPVAGPSQSYYTHKRHSVSDDIPKMGLTLHTESMETCPEEKPTVFTKLKSSMRSTMGKLLPVLLIREPKKPDIRQDEKDPEDLSDSNSSVSDKDSALTGYSNSPSVISKSGSSDMELDTWVGQLPSRTSPRNYTYPHASISHDVRPAFGVPEIKVQDEGEQEGDSPDLSGKLPFDHYGITDSPCSNYKVKTWLGIKELKRPSSPGGSSDDSFYSTNMDVQD